MAGRFSPWLSIGNELTGDDSMKKMVALTLAATAIALAGCDMPDKLEKPNPAATWTSAPTVTGGETITLELSRDGSFKARSKGNLGEEVRSIEGRWSVGENWIEKSCWERIRKSDFDTLARREGNSRVSRASMSLRYWIAKGAELPIGAKVVSKRSTTLPDAAIKSGSSHPASLLPNANPPLPADAKGELWLVEEDAELIRTGRAASASGSLLQWPFAVLSECFGSPDKDAKLHLRFRSRNLAAATS
jgi:hypothetical protein